MHKVVSFILVFVSLTVFAQKENEHISKGNEYYRYAQYDAAEKHYRAALKINPSNTTAQNNLALALYQQKKYKEATEAVTQVHQHTKNKNLRSVAYYNEGVVHTRQKDLDASIEAYKNALRQNPDDQQARENLQKALLERKKQQQQQNQEQKQNNKPQANISKSQAERKLDQLREKEQQTQQRQNEKGGVPQPKDW